MCSGNKLRVQPGARHPFVATVEAKPEATQTIRPCAWAMTQTASKARTSVLDDQVSLLGIPSPQACMQRQLKGGKSPSLLVQKGNAIKGGRMSALDDEMSGAYSRPTPYVESVRKVGIASQC